MTPHRCPTLIRLTRCTLLHRTSTHRSALSHRSSRPFSVSATSREMEKDYTKWSHSDLVTRVKELEKSMKEYGLQLKAAPSISSAIPSTTATGSSRETQEQPEPKSKRKFDPSRYSTRLIALKIAYLGGNYNGFEYQANNPTPLPTVEGKLMEVFLKSRLVAPVDLNATITSSVNDLDCLWPGEDVTQYSKCGRTDRGVSAFGQVIGIRVRSNRPLPKPPPEDGAMVEDTPPFDDMRDELPYVQIMNRLLPPDIQVLAWAPNPPPDFSARFNCIGRHYRYFFTNPAIPLLNYGINKTPQTLDVSGNFTGFLDIPRMQEAAARYIGHHDFRNFCKLDASKQIENFKRFIYKSSIDELPTASPIVSSGETPPAKIYYFDLHGSAFLWHQVRHMIAILFLIGQHLESPEIITTLLDAEKHPRKPQYEMADDRALVLWDCYFPERQLDWIYGKTESVTNKRDRLVDAIWAGWHQNKVEDVLRSELVKIVEGWKKKGLEDERSAGRKEQEKTRALASHILVNGGSEVLFRGKYVPILQRPTMNEVEVLNERYRNKRPERVSGKGKKAKAREARELAARAEEDAIAEDVEMKSEMLVS